MDRQVLLATLRCNLKRTQRDQFLRGALGFVFAVALGLRFGLGWIEGELRVAQGVELSGYRSLMASYFALVNAQTVAGLIVGFLLIETREEGVHRALGVSSCNLAWVTISHIALTAAASLTFSLLLGFTLGLGVPAFAILLFCSLLAAPMAICFALLLGVVAENKVQAFAAAKILSILSLVPPIAYFVPEPYHWIAGIVPIYWPCKIWWSVAQGESWVWMVGPSIATSALWLGLMYWQYQGRVHEQ